jgi:hypothetical protein
MILSPLLHSSISLKKGEKVYQLGAKKGRYQKLKLEAKAGKVLEYRKLKLSNTAIGKLLGRGVF